MHTIGNKLAWSLMLLLSVMIAGYAVAWLAVDGLSAGALKQKIQGAPWSMYAHLGGGAIALFIGPFQVNAAFRNRHLMLHRNLGRIYLTAVATAGLAGLSMATVSDGGAATHFGFGGMAVLWLFTGAMAYTRIRQGDIASHRRWMIRNFSLTLAAVTLRLQLPLYIGAFGLDFESAYQVVSWTCWVPNLLVAEWFFLRGRTT